LKIEGGKGIKLDYIIKHPPFKNEVGVLEPDFTGEYYINSNYHVFYIGDCIWLPAEDKVGTWEIIVYHEGTIIASQIFQITL
jgi:hypothetical protein